MAYYIGLNLGGGIDPLQGFLVTDDLSTVTVENTYSGLWGSEVSVTIPLWQFLDRNPDFYCYGGEHDETVTVEDIRPRAEGGAS